MKIAGYVPFRWTALICAAVLVVLLAGCGGTELAPTPTPIPSAPTPVPVTATTASNTSGAQSSPAEEAYRNKVAVWSVRMGTDLNKFQALDSNPNPASTDWQNNVVSTVTDIQSMSAEPQTWDTPPRYAAVQQKILSAAAHYNDGMALYTQGITKVDSATIQSGRDELAKGNSDIQDASTLIDSLQK